MKRALSALLVLVLAAVTSQAAFAQLAGSCWPKFHRDAANTGLGLYGGTGSDLTWTYTAGGAIKSSPVVGVDGTCYFTCDNGRLYAIAGSGTKLWDYNCNCLGSPSPAIASDGTIYCPSAENYLYAINPNGTLKWRRPLAARVESSISIGTDGTLYFGAGNNLVAFYSSGTQKWSFATAGAVSSTPAIGSDGTIYFGSADAGVYALYSSGSQKWKFTSAGSGGFVASPTLDTDGTVYIGSLGGYFYGIRSSGTQKWRVSVGGEVRSSPAIGPSGNIQFGCRDNKIYAVSSIGAIQWSFATGGFVESSPALGTDGGIYAGSLSGSLHALNPDGTERWHYGTGSAITSSPAVGPAGCLFVGGTNNILYCFAADSTPPIDTTCQDDSGYTSVLDRLHGSWSATDPQSGIFSYEYCIGTTPGAADVAPWLNVGNVTSHTRTGLSLVDKQVYYITARAINGAGLTGDAASSDGVTADATLATAPVVTDDGRYTSIANWLHATWGATDPESGVVGYQYAIGTSPGAGNTVGWTVVGLVTEVTKAGLSLATGTTYYFSVKALNGGGVYGPVGSSDGITVDATPPTTPVVTDDGQYFSTSTSIHASWSSSDNESGVARFDYSVGTSAGATNIQGWTDAGTNVSLTITGLSLANGGTYYVNVRATNGAGLVSTAGSSNGITLDTTPPSTPVVTDDGAFTSSTTQLHAAWTASDAQSGIALYRYAIGTTPGGTNIVNWTDVGTNTSVTKTGLSLTDKQIYYISVIAVNGAGAASAAGSSDGITVDLTPPTTPVVTDDGQYTSSANQLHATWTSGDAESGLSRYEYSIGTSAGATDVVGWTDVALNTSVTRTGLSLVDGGHYYFNVRAYNTVNVVSAVGSSDGITVDTVTPPAPTVTDDGQYTSSSNTLHAVWTAVTSASGISYYEYSVGTSPGGTTVRTWTNVGLVTQVTATGLALQNGVTYYVNVRAVNSLGRAGFVGSSDGIQVDTTAPTTPVVTDSGVWSSSPTTLTASWASSDPESGVVEYKHAVGTAAGGTDVLGWTSAGTQTSLVIGPLPLVDGGRYWISVKSKNAAGMESAVGTSDGITLDLTPPTTPVVTDDGTYTVSTTQLHARWTALDPQSGIARYEYSVGTTAGGTDTLGWTSTTATDYTITGLALTSGVRYYINVRAINAAGSTGGVGSSDGIVVETTPPTTPVVTDGGAYTTSTTALSATWIAEDPETGVARYYYCIGTAVGSDNVVAWTDVGLSTIIARSDLTLTQGTTYFFNVKALNGIGLVSAVGSSDGITVDTTPPGAPTITDDGEFSASTTQLHVVMSCTDPESGISAYECIVGTSPGASDILDWTNGGPGPDVTLTGLTLVHGATYYVGAKAVNGSGITGPVGVSDGVVIDATPPTGLTVWDDGDYTGVADSLHARWAAVDPESGIAGYRYCIGTSPGSANVAEWLDVGNVSEHTRASLSLVAGQIYYITVIAVSGAGGESAPVSSDGIRVDLTPPSTPVVTDSGVYWGYKTKISGNWLAEDPESGIAEYQMSVSTSPGAHDVAPWVSVGKLTSFTRTGLLLSNGVTYYINMKARNGAGSWSPVGSSDGVLVDSTPPTTPVVTDDGDATAVLDRLHATWHSEDPECGIAEYAYCLGTSPGATDVVAWTNVGLTQEITVTGLHLELMLTYYFSVKARSTAGAWSAVGASDGISFATGSAIWGKFRNDPANLGRGLFNATTVNDVAWIIPTQNYVESSPAIAADGVTYIGSADGKLYAVTQNGTIRWTYDAGSAIDSSPAIGPDGKIVFGCANGKVCCVGVSAELLWSYQTGGMVRSSPLIDEGTVYVGSADGSFYALRLSDGVRLWSYAAGGAVKSSPAIDSSNVVYFGSDNGYVYAVKPDGTLKWRFLTGSAVDASPAIGSDGTIYCGSGDGYFYAINPDGTQKWRFATGSLVDSSPAIGVDGNIYFGAGFDGGSGKLYALAPDKTVIWQVNLPGGGIVSSPAIDPAGNIYAGACDSKLYAFRPNGTTLFTYKTGSSVISSPALGGDSSVVFGSYDGKIYCLRDVKAKDLTPPTTPVVTVSGPALPIGLPLEPTWSATDPDSMVAEYTYAVGTGTTEPDNCNVVGWTSAGIETTVSIDSVLLTVGQTYYVSVKARNPSQRWSDIGVSQGIMVTDSGNVPLLSDIRKLSDGFMAALQNKVVTGVFSDCFFVEEPSRYCGIRCIAEGTDLQPGDRVTVTGKVKTVRGRKALDEAGCSSVASGNQIVSLGMTGRTLMLPSPDPIGLYITIWGKASAVGTGYVVVADGSGLLSARGVAGVEVWCDSTSIKIGDTVMATGVLCDEEVNEEPAAVVRTLSTDDVRVIPL